MDTHTFCLKNGISVCIREGIQPDVNQIWQLFNLVVRERKYLPTIYPLYAPQETANWFYEINRPRNLLLVAEYENRIIGYLTLETCSDDASTHVSSLGILIHPLYRRQGLGADLIKFGILQAKEKKYQKIILSVFNTNIGAIRLYEKFNFKIVGKREKQFKVNDQYINEILMELLIE